MGILVREVVSSRIRQLVVADRLVSVALVLLVAIVLVAAVASRVSLAEAVAEVS